MFNNKTVLSKITTNSSPESEKVLCVVIKVVQKTHF